MKPLKIIHLSCFSNGEKPERHPSIDEDYFYVASWAGLIARRLKEFRPDLDIEIWRAENVIDKINEKLIFNIKGIIWPYKRPIIKNLLTLKMIRRLNELKKDYFLILHYHDIYNLRFTLVIKFLCPGIKIVLSHHGGTPPKNKTIKFRLINFFYKEKWISYITYLSTETKYFLESIKHHPPLKFLPVGADFDQFIIKNKTKIRQELNLEQNKIYGIYVGKFYRLKSVDHIIKVYNELKTKYNFSIIFVGGSNKYDNDLYEEVINTGCPWFGITPWPDMVKYYNAADFYIHPAFNPAFGGLDVSWIEALACNKPVLSSQLTYLDFDYSDLGILIKNESEIIEKTEWMIKNYKIFTKCREVSKKHFDGKTAIMEQLNKIYDEIYS
jgi:glycosyltransferase involved in cell wall biosynthesis